MEPRPTGLDKEIVDPTPTRFVIACFKGTDRSVGFVQKIKNSELLSGGYRELGKRLRGKSEAWSTQFLQANFAGQTLIILDDGDDRGLVFNIQRTLDIADVEYRIFPTVELMYVEEGFPTKVTEDLKLDFRPKNETLPLDAIAVKELQ